MVDAAIAGDGDATAEAIAAHYVRTAKIVAKALDPEYRLDRLRTTVATVAPGALAELG
jgi:hypothetical protein